MFQTITKENWLLFAQKHYDNPTLEKEAEFYDDLKRFKYLKRLFRKYEISGRLKVRLALNHIIVLQNVFGVEACVILLLYKIDTKHWSVLKALLTYLDYLYPNELHDVNEDKNIKEILRGFYGN
tara:strand:+ start:2924 stop:3295 length:372 start_codon:yes stop_codon:yes gene_type:complete